MSGQSLASMFVSGLAAVGALVVGLQIFGGGKASNVFGASSIGAESSSGDEGLRGATEKARKGALKPQSAQQTVQASSGKVPSLAEVLATSFRGPPVMVLITAEWCGHCKSLKEGEEYKALKSGSQAFPVIGTRLLEVDGDDKKAMEALESAGYAVEGFPTALLFGKEPKGIELQGFQKSIAEALQNA